MATKKRDPVLVILQLSGGNDCLNTIVPYGNGLYFDNRPNIGIPAEDVLPIDGDFGFNPNMGPIKGLWDEGNVAIINGIGYSNPVRSHFRSLDIWHTAEPDRIGSEGWLGRAVRDLDPQGENSLTCINFGRGLPRALSCKGVSVTSVGDMETYGLFPDQQDQQLREYALDAFTMMYGGAKGRDAVIDFLGQTGLNLLEGADILQKARAEYSSRVEYAANPIAQGLKSVSQALFAALGTRVFYTQHSSFDTHNGQLPTHAKLWSEVSTAVGDFMDDLKEHGREDDVIILAYSEFGRRIQDNVNGTDHGSGGVAFVIGAPVNGGMYGEYPSLKEENQLNHDLHYNNDFRSTYSTVLEQWLGLDAVPIVNGHFEQFDLIKTQPA